MGTNPPPGPEGDPMAGLDAALGGAMDQAMDQGAGGGARYRSATRRGAERQQMLQTLPQSLRQDRRADSWLKNNKSLRAGANAPALFIYTARIQEYLANVDSLWTSFLNHFKDIMAKVRLSIRYSL